MTRPAHFAPGPSGRYKVDLTDPATSGPPSLTVGRDTLLDACAAVVDHIRCATAELTPDRPLRVEIYRPGPMLCLGFTRTAAQAAAEMQRWVCQQYAATALVLARTLAHQQHPLLANESGPRLMTADWIDANDRRTDTPRVDRALTQACARWAAAETSQAPGISAWADRLWHVGVDPRFIHVLANSIDATEAATTPRHADLREQHTALRSLIERLTEPLQQTPLDAEAAARIRRLLDAADELSDGHRGPYADASTPTPDINPSPTAAPELGL